MPSAPGSQSYIDGIVTKLAKTPQQRERLSTHVPAFWAQQTTQSANLTKVALLTMLDAIQLELGNLDEEVTPQPEGDWHPRETTRQMSLMDMYKITQQQLTIVGASSSGAPAFGVMTATVPIPSWPGAPNANSSRYKGNPNVAPWWVQSI